MVGKKRVNDVFTDQSIDYLKRAGTKGILPLENVRFKVLYLLAIWEGEAPAELLRHGSAGASPSRPMNLQVAKPDDLSGRVTKSVNYRF